MQEVYSYDGRYTATTKPLFVLLTLALVNAHQLSIDSSTDKIFVAPNGTDVPLCGQSFSTACATIQYAINMAISPATLILGNGLFTGPGNVNVTLFGRSLSIVANQSLESVIDCNNSSYAAFYFDNNANATLSGIVLQHCRSSDGSIAISSSTVFLTMIAMSPSCSGLVVDQSGHVIIRNSSLSAQEPQTDYIVTLQNSTAIIGDCFWNVTLSAAVGVFDGSVLDMTNCTVVVHVQPVTYYQGVIIAGSASSNASVVMTNVHFTTVYTGRVTSNTFVYISGGIAHFKNCVFYCRDMFGIFAEHSDIHLESCQFLDPQPDTSLAGMSSGVVMRSQSCSVKIDNCFFGNATLQQAECQVISTFYGSFSMRNSYFQNMSCGIAFSSVSATMNNTRWHAFAGYLNAASGTSLTVDGSLFSSVSNCCGTLSQALISADSHSSLNIHLTNFTRCSVTALIEATAIVVEDCYFTECTVDDGKYLLTGSSVNITRSVFIHNQGSIIKSTASLQHPDSVNFVLMGVLMENNVADQGSLMMADSDAVIQESAFLLNQGALLSCNACVMKGTMIADNYQPARDSTDEGLVFVDVQELLLLAQCSILNNKLPPNTHDRFRNPPAFFSSMKNISLVSTEVQKNLNACGGPLFSAEFILVVNSLVNHNVAGSAFHIIQILMVSSSFHSNTAAKGGAVIQAANDLIVGGSQSCLPRTFTVNAYLSNFTSNTAYRSGGAISLLGEGTASFVSCFFERNIAQQSGGALWVSKTQFVSLRDCKFFFNVASRSAGAISAQFTKVYDEGGIYSDNRSHHRGGAIFTEFVDMVLTGSQFKRNSGMFGGGIHIDLGGAIDVLRNTTFSLNVALLGGGTMLLCSSSQLNVDSAAFYSNKAQIGGGILALDFGCIQIHSTSFTYNDALSSANDLGMIKLSLGLCLSNPIVIKHSTFTGARKTSAHSIYCSSVEATVLLQNVSFVGMGTAVSAKNTELVVVEESTFSNATNGILAAETSLSVFDSDFHSSIAVSVGFVTKISCLLMLLNNCQFSNNSFAVFISQESCVQPRTLINQCRFLGNGPLPAVQANTDSCLFITNSEFRSNQAKTNGGAVSMKGQTIKHMLFSNVTFVDNLAALGGGAVSIERLNFQNTTHLGQNVTAYHNTALLGGFMYEPTLKCFQPPAESINLFVDSFFSTNIALLGSNMAVYVPQHAVEYSNVSFCDATVDARQSCRVFHPNCDLCVGNSNGVASTVVYPQYVSEFPTWSIGMQPVTIAVQAVDGLGNRLTGQLISVFQAYFSMSLSTPCSFPQGQNLSTSISPQTGEGVFSNLVIYGRANTTCSLSLFFGFNRSVVFDHNAGAQFTFHTNVTLFNMSTACSTSEVVGSTSTHDICIEPPHPWRWAILCFLVIAFLSVVIILAIFFWRLFIYLRRRHLLKHRLEELRTRPLPSLEQLIADPLITFIRWSDLEMLGIVGKGAYGTVRKALRISTGMFVAVKEVFHGDDVAMERFRSECKLLSSLDHPNIVKFMGLCLTTNQELLLVSEFVDGGNLASSLGSMDRATQWKVLIGVCEAMLYLHGKNVIHRDLKPENVLLSTAMEPKVADFGESTIQTGGAISNMTIAGTPSYAAPEVFSKQYDKRADVYSFGVLMNEILCGIRPYSDLDIDSSGFGFVDEIANGLRPSIAPDVDARVVGLIADCWDADPDSRPTFSEIYNRLKRLKSTLLQEDSLSLELNLAGIVELGDTV